jgi:hypothetical protein
MLNVPDDSFKMEWLRNNLPVMVQPKIDTLTGNRFRAMFVDFKPHYVHLRTIYDGEASYNRYHKSIINQFGSLLYRTFNMLVYRRTADVESLIYDTRQSPKGWDMIYVRDSNHTQNWNRGDVLQLFTFSIFYHYKTTAWFNEWELYPGTTRPIVYSNTCNHLHGPKNMNEDMEMKIWDTYPVYEGGYDEAERYAQTVCNVDFNLITCCRRQKRSQYQPRSLRVFKIY